MNHQIHNPLALKDKKSYSAFNEDLKSRFEQFETVSNLISQGGDFQKLTAVR
ncbi:MAG TPA: hypothetical protein VJC13_01140 [Candidatus Paceibacterota bacterium]|nr:hypothetical protein [uncultured archaeon]